MRGLRSLLALELRELASARSAALLVLLMGPLVAQAFASGADYIVVGRPIRQAAEPRAAAEAIQASIAAAIQ